IIILKSKKNRNLRNRCNCTEVKKESEPARPSNSEIQTYFVVPQKGLHLRDITLGEKTIPALIDTSSSVSLIREAVSMKIVNQQKLSKKYNVPSGIGESHVLTKDSFEHDLVLDKYPYSLTWYVVPTKQLNRSCHRHRRFITSFFKVHRRWYKVAQI
ncbi:transposon Tf2-8 polyprotein, partial [Nephila pilipes]